MQALTRWGTIKYYYIFFDVLFPQTGPHCFCHWVVCLQGVFSSGWSVFRIVPHQVGPSQFSLSSHDINIRLAVHDTVVTDLDLIVRQERVGKVKLKVMFLGKRL